MSGTTWFLVSDASRAKLLREKDQVFEEVADFIHPESAQPTSDLISGQAGRRGQGTRGGTGDGSRPGLSAATTPREAEAARFARELADHLRKGLNAHRYHALILVAPPHFLGLLRAALDPQVEKRVLSAHAKDYLELAPRALIAKLESMLLPQS